MYLREKQKYKKKTPKNVAVRTFFLLASSMNLFAALNFYSTLNLDVLERSLRLVFLVLSKQNH